MVAGIEQRFSMRPKPACIGIPPGVKRIQASRTCGAQSPAKAGAADAASSTNAITAEIRFMRL